MNLHSRDLFRCTDMQTAVFFTDHTQGFLLFVVSFRRKNEIITYWYSASCGELFLCIRSINTYSVSVLQSFLMLIKVRMIGVILSEALSLECHTMLQSLQRSCNVLTAWWRPELQATPNGLHGSWGGLKHSTAQRLVPCAQKCRFFCCKKEAVTYQQSYAHPLLISLGEGCLGNPGGIFLQHLTQALGQDLQSKSNRQTHF